MPVRKNLYIFGGLVRGRGGSPEYVVSKEMWRFAIDARKWTGPIVSISLFHRSSEGKQFVSEILDYILKQ